MAVTREKLAVFTCMVVLLSSPSGHTKEDGTIVGGFPKRHMDGPTIQLIQDNFRLFTEYVGERIGRKIVLIPVEDINDLRKKLSNKELDFTWAWTAAETVKIWGEYPITPFVSIDPIRDGVRRKGFRFLLITRSGNGCKKLEDLRGKTLLYLNSEDGIYKDLSLVFVDTLLKKEGKDIAKFFKLVPYGSDNMQTTNSVALEYGRSKDLILRVLADPQSVASVGEEAFLLMARRNPRVQDMVTVIAATEPFSPLPFFVWRDADQDTIQKIKKVLLAMHEDPRGEEILRSVKIGSWVDVGENAYDNLKKLFVEASMLKVRLEL